MDRQDLDRLRPPRPLRGVLRRQLGPLLLLGPLLALGFVGCAGPAVFGALVEARRFPAYAERAPARTRGLNPGGVLLVALFGLAGFVMAGLISGPV